MQSLQDAAGGLHNGEKHHGQAGNAKQFTGNAQVFGGKRFRIEKSHNGLSQQAHANGAGEPNEEGKPYAKVALPDDRPAVMDGHGAKWRAQGSWPPPAQAPWEC